MPSQRTMECGGILQQPANGVTIMLRAVTFAYTFVTKEWRNAAIVIYDGFHRKVRPCVVMRSVPRSLDIKSNGKVASSSYAENVLGPAMAGQQQPTLLPQTLPPR